MKPLCWVWFSLYLLALSLSFGHILPIAIEYTVFLIVGFGVPKYLGKKRWLALNQDFVERFK